MLKKLDYCNGYYVCNNKLYFGDRCNMFRNIDLPLRCVRFAVEQGCDMNQMASRPGGKIKRDSVAMTANTLQGKMGEELFKRMLEQMHIKCSEIDYSRTELGVPDDGDLTIYNNIETQIKSTSYLGNCLFLECANIKKTLNMYSIFVLVRTRPHINRKLLLDIGIDYPMFVNRKVDNICEIIINKLNNKVDSEIVGFAPREMVKDAISSNNVIRQDEMLNKTIMDADNYYILACDLKSLSELSSIGMSMTV